MHFLNVRDSTGFLVQKCDKVIHNLQINPGVTGIGPNNKSSPIRQFNLLKLFI